MRIKSGWKNWMRKLATLMLVGTLSSQSDAGEKLALLIGVNDYSKSDALAELEFAAKDVSDLRSTLLASGYAPANVVILNGENGNSAPSRQNILEAVEKLQKRDGERASSVMLVFAGHGFNENAESYLCSEDYSDSQGTESALSVSVLAAELMEVQADAHLLILDACRNEFVADRNTEFNLSNPLDRMELQENSTAQGMVILSSCMPQQMSFESRELKNGVFLHFLNKGLRGAADFEADGNGIVTDHELTEYVSSHTMQFTQRRFDTPQIPWAESHATAASIPLVELSMEVRAELGRVERKTGIQLRNEQMAEMKTADGVMLLVGGNEMFRQRARQRFGEAIELAPEMYMPRRLNSLMCVMEGNGNPSRAAEMYSEAISDMTAVNSTLRVVVPYSAEEVSMWQPAAGKNRYSRMSSKLTRGDVVEVVGMQTLNGRPHLKISRVHHWREEGAVGDNIESVTALVSLSEVATAEANPQLLEDLNRSRKPTTEEIRQRQRSLTASGSEVANGLRVAGAIANTAGAGKVGGKLAAAAPIVDAAARLKQAKQQGRRDPAAARQLIQGIIRIAR
jgi:uncharacterized caspase-like protein